MAETVRIKSKNRIKHVAPNRVEAYLKQGYDQIDKNGKIVKRATGGKSISLAEHNKVLDELTELIEGNAVDELKEQIESLKKENKSLKSKITKLEKSVKEDDKDDKEVS